MQAASTTQPVTTSTNFSSSKFNAAKTTSASSSSASLPPRTVSIKSAIEVSKMTTTTTHNNDGEEGSEPKPCTFPTVHTTKDTTTTISSSSSSSSKRKVIDTVEISDSETEIEIEEQPPKKKKFVNKEHHPRLQTFYIGDEHLPTHESRVKVGRAIVEAIQSDSIINISINGIIEHDVIPNAYKAQKEFFDLPLKSKMQCHNDLSYGGYVYSGEEETAGKKDAAEIFTVTREHSLEDDLVKNGTPCHGPMPWPTTTPDFKQVMSTYASSMRSIGDRVLPLIALGLGLDEHAFDEVTKDSWGHMRVLKFRAQESEGTPLQGIGSHTDYGMLVLATQDKVGGLWVRPHKSNEKRKDNWIESSAGDFGDDTNGWKFVVPESNVVTCFPGDMLQFITRGKLMSTPHKVELADRIRYAIAYFHEPSFGAVIRREDTNEEIQYGKHFTNMFKRCYPDKPVTKAIISQKKEANLEKAIIGSYSF